MSKKNIKPQKIDSTLEFDTARSISNHIAHQIKRRHDNIHLSRDLTFVNYLTRHYFSLLTPVNICGIDVICSAKLIEAQKGRKRKIKVSLGKLRKQTSNSSVEYCFTKVGTTTIKVWLYYNDYSI
jgi:hypothetical protein